MILKNCTTETAARATGIATSRPVIECPQPADAASPVFLHRGQYRQQIGQAADWKHRTEIAAEQHGAVEVAGYYRDGQWETAIEGVTAEQETRIREIIREDNRREDARQQAKMKLARETEERARSAKNKDWTQNDVPRIVAAACRKLGIPIQAAAVSQWGDGEGCHWEVKIKGYQRVRITPAEVQS